MAIECKCQCGNVFNIGDHMRGTEIRCPECRQTLIVGEEPLEAILEEEASRIDLEAERGVSGLVTVGHRPAVPFASGHTRAMCTVCLLAAGMVADVLAIGSGFLNSRRPSGMEPLWPRSSAGFPVA